MGAAVSAKVFESRVEVIGARPGLRLGRALAVWFDSIGIVGKQFVVAALCFCRQVRCAEGRRSRFAGSGLSGAKLSGFSGLYWVCGTPTPLQISMKMSDFCILYIQHYVDSTR